MLQQTTVAAVREYFIRFVTRWPTVADLAAADDGEVMAAWAGLGYYARARNLLKCARMVTDELAGRFPETEAELQKLPGIGPYTSAAIAAIAYDHPATVLDGNVERVMARLRAVQEPLPTSKETLRAHAAQLTPEERAGDYAQAVMDLGATVCTPRSPSCGACPLAASCQARDLGIAAELPRKLRKPAKPVRLGVAYVARRSDGAVLLERRPDKGLLGGMLAWPGSDWAEVLPDHTPPLAADWQDLGDEVRHTFTHFHLRLRILVSEVEDESEIQSGAFVPASEFDPAALPTVMRKVWAMAAPQP
jgi:A/G-specific adenine glycosylase